MWYLYVEAFKWTQSNKRFHKTLHCNSKLEKCGPLCFMITCQTPHHQKSNSLVPGHDLSSPLLSHCWMISQVSSLLLHSLTYGLGRYFSVQRQIPSLPHHHSLGLCSGLTRFAVVKLLQGLAGRTAAPWLGSESGRSLAGPTALWTQQWPPPALYGQRRGAGPGLHRLPLRFLRSGWWVQGFETWSPNVLQVPVSQVLRFCNILSNCWWSHSHFHSAGCYHRVTHRSEAF